MKTKIAKILRQLADRLAPAPVVVRPTKGEVQYEGVTYKPVVLRSLRHIPPYVQGEVVDAAKRFVREDLEARAGTFVELDHRESYDPDEVAVAGKIIILTKC